MPPRVLATDLDGTLIPLAGNARNAADLRELEQELHRSAIQLIFVTGRHLASVAAVIPTACLPIPDWIIADVGTSIYQRVTARPAESCDDLLQQYALSESYAAELGRMVGEFSVERLSNLLSSLTALRLQEPEKQSQFKLSYYVDRGQLADIEKKIASQLQAAQAPYSIVASVDPFNDDGLIDLLPRSVTKAHGIEWWSAQQGIARSQILYAGDSGNDAAAFAAGFCSIVVSNAHPQVLHGAQQAHAEAGWTDRLYAAELPATSGVLAGLKHYLLA